MKWEWGHITSTSTRRWKQYKRNERDVCTDVNELAEELHFIKYSIQY